MAKNWNGFSRDAPEPESTDVSDGACGTIAVPRAYRIPQECDLMQNR
jgi:hypothetical protein